MRAALLLLAGRSRLGLRDDLRAEPRGRWTWKMPGHCGELPVRSLLALSTALFGCSGHATQSSVDAAPSCLGHAAVGTWAGLANDGTLVDTVPRITFATDCTFSSGMQRGTWTASPGGHELVMTWDGAFSPQAAYVSGDRMLIGVEGRLSNGGSPGNPSGTTWTWTSGACCANGSPYSITWDLSLDPSGSYIEHWIPSSFQGPMTMTCSGTWLAKSLGFDLTGTADACGQTTRRFVWLDSDIGGGYQRQ